MVTHSSILAWRIPWTEEPGACGVVESDTTGQLTLQHQCRLHSCRSPVNPKKKTSCWYRSKMGLFGNSKALQLEKKKLQTKPTNKGEECYFTDRKEEAGGVVLNKSQPTPISLPGKFHGRRSLAGYSPWGQKDSDMTDRLHHGRK